MTPAQMGRMQRRLKAALTCTETFLLVRADLIHTVSSLGFQLYAEGIVDDIIDKLKITRYLRSTELLIHHELKRTRLPGTSHSLFDAANSGLEERARTIFVQVGGFFQPCEAVVDWGCGDGQVTDLIHTRVTTNIVGYDVCSYPSPGLNVPIHQFDGGGIDVNDDHFDAGLATNVFHHEETNTRILRELARIIRHEGRLVVIETVPVEDSPEQFDRTFVNDYFYNRLLHEANIPVPGTYETAEGWVRRLNKVGFDIDTSIAGLNPLPLGYDQRTIRDWHILYVLRRNKHRVP